MHTELEFQANLAKEYGYKKLPEDLSLTVKQRYLDKFPVELQANFPLYSTDGTLIALGYDRIVIGDYGAFLEIDKYQLVHMNVKVKEGQEYRYDDQYSKCKYYWLTANDNSDIKIYHQKGTVDYADYKKEKYYVSPYEVRNIKWQE